MCYTRRKIEGGVGALRGSDDANFLKPNGQSRNLNIKVVGSYEVFMRSLNTSILPIFLVSSPFRLVKVKQ